MPLRFRIAYLGLTMSLRSISFIICIPGFILLSRQVKEEERNAIHGALTNGGTELEALRKEEFVINNSSDNSTDRETRLWRMQQKPSVPFTHEQLHILSQSVRWNCTHAHSQSHKWDLQGIMLYSIISFKVNKFYICTTGPVTGLWI